MQKKILCALLATALLIPSFGNAYAEEPKTLTLSAAIEQGLKNSLTMQEVENQAKIADLVKDHTEDTQRTLYEASNTMSDAENRISQGRQDAYSALNQLESAQAALDNGISPVDLTIPTPSGEVSIPAGSRIPDELRAQVIPMLQAELNQKRTAVNQGLKDLDGKTQEYLSGKTEYELSVQFGMTSVASKLSTSTITSLDPVPLANLLKEMGKVQDEVTQYSIQIYKNQIAMQIQNSYFEALKQQSLLAVKEKTLERAKLQLEYADFAYEVGAKSKDDRNLAKLYYDGAVMARDLQQKEAANALTTLKKHVNLPLDTSLMLVTPTAEALPPALDLNQGITSGLNTRLELKKCRAQIALYEELKTAVEQSGYSDGKDEYEEAELLLEKAGIQSKATSLEVESGIRQSYETVTTMEKVAKTAQELLTTAEETLEIAKLKYEVGFGADNALLSSMNLKDISGTMVEVIAAEENLAQMEEKLIEATNGYQLAHIKYRNDIGILPYK